jgi:hypothetical protein
MVCHRGDACFLRSEQSRSDHGVAVFDEQILNWDGIAVIKGRHVNRRLRSVSVLRHES